jgi:hypothetical protein
MTHCEHALELAVALGDPGLEGAARRALGNLLVRRNDLLVS